MPNHEVAEELIKRFRGLQSVCPTCKGSGKRWYGSGAAINVGGVGITIFRGHPFV